MALSLDALIKQHEEPKPHEARFHNPALFKQLEDVHQRMDVICQVQVPDGSGTGCLIGGNLLITNHHVIPDKETAAKSYALFFRVVSQDADKKRTLVEIVRLRIEPSRYFYSSPDRKENEKLLPADAEHLDFTIVALEPDPYLQEVKVRVFSIFNRIEPEMKSLACILQHPSVIDSTIALKGDLKWSIGLIHKKENCSIHYDTETTPGSSGGAVMNKKGELLALHYQTVGKCGCDPMHPYCNAGVLMTEIAEHLEKKGERAKIERHLETYSQEHFWPHKKHLEVLKAYYKACGTAVLSLNEYKKIFIDLRQIVEDYKEAIFKIKSEIQLNELMKQDSFSLDLIVGLSNHLSKEEQLEDSLKRELCNTILVFLEFFVFQYVFEKKRIDQDVLARMKNNFAKALNTLPKTEVEAHFYLYCSRACVKYLLAGFAGLFKISKEDAKPEVAKEVVNALRAAPVWRAEAAAPFVSRLIDLSITIYRGLKDSYKNVWALRWHYSGKRITTKAQLDGAKPLMKDFEGGFLQIYYLSFCISQIFLEIYQNQEVKDDLRKAVFEEEKVSLLKLTELHWDKAKFDDDESCWKTRYVTLSFLAKIAEDRTKGHESYRRKSIVAILDSWILETAEVKVLAGSLISDLAPRDIAVWTTPLEDLAKEQIRFSNAQREELNKQIMQYEEKIERILEKLPKAPIISPEGSQH